MNTMPGLRGVIKVDGVYYVEMDIVLRERGRLYLWAEINQECMAVMECKHCEKPIAIRTLDDIDRYNQFLLCEECMKKGETDVVIDEFQVKKAFNVAYGAIDPGKYEFVSERNQEEYTMFH